MPATWWLAITDNGDGTFMVTAHQPQLNRLLTLDPAPRADELRAVLEALKVRAEFVEEVFAPPVKKLSNLELWVEEETLRAHGFR